MCYSKEVSASAAVIIFILSTLARIRSKTSSVLKSRILIFLITGYFFIGIHQLFEFLAIYLESQIIYKTGLIFSITAMFFNIRASELFLSKNLGSRLIILILGLLSIYIFATPMEFENMHFYVRGKQHIYWGATWMLFFLYWNSIHIFTYFKSSDRKFKKVTLLFTTFSLNISFLLSAIYCYTIGFISNNKTISKDIPNCSPILSNFEIVFDAPSIWCLFATIQGFFLYYFVRYTIQENYIKDINVDSKMIKYSVITSVVISLVILTTLPVFSALSIKMMLK